MTLHVILQMDDETRHLLHGITCKLDAMEERLMALADTLAQLVAENADIKSDVESLIGLQASEAQQIADLQAQIAALEAGSVTPEQLASLQSVADGLAATHAEAQAALPVPAPAPSPAPEPAPPVGGDVPTP